MRKHLTLLLAAALVSIGLLGYAATYAAFGEAYLESTGFVARIFPGKHVYRVYYPAGLAEALVLRKRVMLGERNEFGHLCLATHHNPWRLPLRSNPPDNDCASSQPTPTTR